jgi:hypothetical protein
MIDLQARIRWLGQGSNVTDEDLVEAACRMLNIGSRTRSFEHLLGYLAPDAELVIGAPQFRATWDRRGIEVLVDALPEDAVFGYCEALHDGSAVVGRFTADSFRGEPTLGRYVLRRDGDRIERLELRIGPAPDDEAPEELASWLAAPQDDDRT